jgi:hypothetical protein
VQRFPGVISAHLSVLSLISLLLLQASDDKVQAFHPRSRYAASIADAEGDGDAEDLPGDELAGHGRGGAAAGKKKKRKDDDEDDEEEPDQPKARSDIENLLASYKDKRDRPTNASTLLTANRHAQKKSPEPVRRGDQDELVTVSPAKGTRINMKAVMKAEDDDEFDEPSAEPGVHSDEDNEQPAAWEQRQRNTEDIDALRGPAFSLKHKAKAPVATPNRPQQRRQPSNQDLVSPISRQRSTKDVHREQQPQHQQEDAAQSWMPGQIEQHDDDSHQSSQSWRDRPNYNANKPSAAQSAVTSVAKSTRHTVEEDEFAY